MVIYKCISALAFVHERGIYYGEVSPVSLLISEKFEIMFSDFVISVFGEPKGKYKIRGLNFSCMSHSLSKAYEESQSKGIKHFYDKDWEFEELQFEDRLCLAASLFPEAINIEN